LGGGAAPCSPIRSLMGYPQTNSLIEVGKNLTL
jgi:hypothetical protein